jgi:signal transduction histidine kinase
MKTLTLEYKSLEDIKRFSTQNKIVEEKNVLVQIFTSINQISFISSLTSFIKEIIPSVKIIGATSNGEISFDGINENSTIISFSIFDSTRIETSLIEHKNSSFDTGKNIINSFKNNTNNELKLIISFADGLNTNGEDFLRGISSVNDKVIVSGGLAGDPDFETTIVFTENGITTNGAVGAALYNQKLNIYTDYSFNWESVGKKHIVTKSKENRVYEISGMKTIDFYKYYLGDDIAKLLPAIGIEFPLVIQNDGVKIARAAISKNDDGSLSFAGNINEGSIVQFGHGDVQMIISKGLENVKSIIEQPIESIFIYSCMARKNLLKADINLEILPLREIAPISGFFTHGEFFYDCNNQNCQTQLLNQTMTILAISECDKTIEQITPNIFSSNPENINDMQLHRTQALSNLIEQTTKELEELNNNLEQKVQTEIVKNKEKDSMLQMMQSQTQLGEMLEMIIHQWRQPISAITSSVTSLQIYKESDILSDEILDKSLNDMLNFSEHLNSTIEDFRDLFKSNMKIENIDGKKLVKKSLTILKPLLKKKEINLIENYNCENNINVSIGLVMQVILNIIKNSIDILEERDINSPFIELKTSIDNDLWLLEIKDNGGGIPKDILPQIFKKRFSTKLNSHGTGLGLNMSKTIIETKLNGELSAKNSKEGAVFTIKLPL